MQQNKTKKSWYKSVIFIVILLVIVSCFFYKQKENSDFIKTYFQVIDKYNTRYFSMEELDNMYSQPDFLENLVTFNDELINHLDSEYQFIEFNASPIELIGHWNKPLSLANGYGHKDLTNQQIEHEGKQVEITPVNAIQLGKESQILLLNEEIFQENDFQQEENHISLVLGNDFKDYYKIGDEIEFIYLYKTWVGTVKGFLDEQTEIKMDEFTTYNLDNFIILPFFENLLVETDSYYDKNFKINYYIAKNFGYIRLKNKEEYESAKNYIENVADKYNLEYTVLRGY